MNKYIRIDAEQFLKDSRAWPEDLDRLHLELESVVEISGASDSPGRSSEPSKPVEVTAISRDDVLSRIARIESLKQAFAYAWERVSDYDRQMIQGFFFDDKPAYQFVEAWCKEYASNARYCYRDRRAAINHFRDHLENWGRAHGYDV